jgi:hypothetical protein
MARRTFVYDEKTGKVVEGTPRSRSHSGDGYQFSDRIYSDNPFVASDGTVIDSRAKHRAYMKRNKLTTMDDYTDTWAKARKERESFYQGTNTRVNEDRKRDLINVVNRMEKRRG